MFDNIYNREELEGLAGGNLQNKGTEIKQRFDQRRSYYHQQRNLGPYDPEQWSKMNNLIVHFDNNEFKTWNQQWSNIHRAQNIDQYDNFFKQGKKIFTKMESEFLKIPRQYSHSEDVEILKEEILSQIRDDINELKNETTNQIDQGIQNLIDLKAEYKLEDTFAKNISSLHKLSQSSREKFFRLFVGSIICIPIFVLISYLIPTINELPISFQLGIRIAVSIALGTLSYFFFNQYRMYQIMTIKYSHLNNFIGGGATFLSELIGVEDDERRVLNRKIANMFIEIGDLMSTIKNSKHIADSSLENANKTIETITKGLSELNKTKNSA